MTPEQRLSAPLLIALILLVLITASHTETRTDLEALRAQCARLK